MPIKTIDLIPRSYITPRVPVKDAQTRNFAAEVVSRITPIGAVNVFPDISGGMRVVWYRNPEYKRPLYLSQTNLEYSEAPNSDNPDNWITVLESAPTYSLSDPIQRFFGQQIVGAYRIKLIGIDTWYSEPIIPTGNLSFTEYKTALKIIRAELRNPYHNSPGFLFKRKQMGERCRCIDPLTEENKIPSCPDCFNTGYYGGFYAPVECPMAVSQPDRADRVDQEGRGPFNRQAIEGRIIGYYAPMTQDVWMNSRTSEMWRVQAVKPVVTIADMDVVSMCAMQRVPDSDPIVRLKKFVSATNYLNFPN